MKNRLKVARAEKDLTQEDLAKLIGVSRQSINAIESGRYVPSTVLALKMAQVFGKPLRRFSSWRKEIEGLIVLGLCVFFSNCKQG